MKVIGKFFGLSAVTLSLSTVNPITFPKLVESLDTASDRVLLTVLKKDLEELIKFLEGLPAVYEVPELNRISAMLNHKRYSSEEERQEMEKKLEGHAKVLSRVVGGSSVNKLSDGAYKIIEILYSRLNMIKYFYNNIHYSDSNSGVTVLNEKLYLLRESNIWRIENAFYKKFNELNKSYKGRNNKNRKEVVNKLREDYKILETYLTDQEVSYNIPKIKESVTQLEEVVKYMNIDYFNSLLEMELTEEQYFSITLELHECGLVGFSIYTEQLFEQFRQTASMSGSSDLFIYKETALYEFSKFIKKILETYNAIEGGA
jgi:hypothetical protein